MDSSVRWLSDRAARASAHLVVGRDGSITQLVPFDRVAWHAGPSRWEGIEGLNRHSIGIELDNAGRLEDKGGAWCAWFGAAYPEDQVMVAAHRNDPTACGWHVFPEAQLRATLEVAQMLVEKYELRDVIGHDDISPGRKWDPGPAFPMESFRARLFGRDDDRRLVYETTARLNIRTGPGTEHDALPEGPLPEGTRVNIDGQHSVWRLVTLSDPGNGLDVEGWVHGNYLRRSL